jgi:transposase
MATGPRRLAQCRCVTERRSWQPGPRRGTGRRYASGKPGNIADISVAKDLLDTLAPPKRLLADKAYDADHLRNWLKARRVRAVIPSNATRRTPYPLDKVAYKRRNLIERMFCRLKDWRRIATCYDRTARNFLSALALAATLSFWAK